MSLIAELKRRKVFKVGAAYLVVGWLAVQAASIAFPAFDAPAWALRVFILLALLGFPLVVVMAWIFDATPEGMKVDASTPGNKRVFAGAAVLIVLALGWYFYGQPTFRKGHSTTPVAAVPAAAAATDKSIAVLPFVNMSSDKEQEYFSDGLSEELLNLLAQLPQLRVIARTSSFSFKGKEVDVATIAKALGVANVLEGSVRKSGNTLRITAQLIRASDSSHLWSHTYDRELTDVFKVQDEIAGAIADALEAKLGGRPTTAAPAHTANPAAYDDYLQGRAFFARRVDDNLKLAVAAFDRAIARDPSYSAAYAGRAFALAISPLWDMTWLPREEIIAKSRAAADQALVLDPENVEAHIALAVIAQYELDVTGARKDLERAYALAPDNVDVLNFFADFEQLVGNLRAAERMKRRAMALDPLAFVHPLNLAFILADQARFADALVMAERGRALGNPYGAEYEIYLRLWLKQFDAAESALAPICKENGAESFPCLDKQMMLSAFTGQASEATAAWTKLRKRELAKPRSEDYSYMAAVYLVAFNDIPRATQAMRMSLKASNSTITSPLTFGNHGARLPEEISQDPEWLAVWADPKLRPLMDEYRKNIIAFRKGG